MNDGGALRAKGGSRGRAGRQRTSAGGREEGGRKDTGRQQRTKIKGAQTAVPRKSDARRESCPALRTCGPRSGTPIYLFPANPSSGPGPAAFCPARLRSLRPRGPSTAKKLVWLSRSVLENAHPAHTLCRRRAESAGTMHGDTSPAAPPPRAPTAGAQAVAAVIAHFCSPFCPKFAHVHGRFGPSWAHIASTSRTQDRIPVTCYAVAYTASAKHAATM